MRTVQCDVLNIYASWQGDRTWTVSNQIWQHSIFASVCTIKSVSTCVPMDSRCLNRAPEAEKKALQNNKLSHWKNETRLIVTRLPGVTAPKSECRCDNHVWRFIACIVSIHIGSNRVQCYMFRISWHPKQKHSLQMLNKVCTQLCTFLFLLLYTNWLSQPFFLFYSTTALSVREDQLESDFEPTCMLRTQ